LPLVKKFLPSRLDQVSDIGYQIEMFLLWCEISEIKGREWSVIWNPLWFSKNARHESWANRWFIFTCRR
jgi:hypothetical protein